MSDEVKALEFRKRVLGDMQALKHACWSLHKQDRRPGGAAICICGCGSGGAPGCAALCYVRDFLEALDPAQVPAEWRAWLEAAQGAL